MKQKVFRFLGLAVLAAGLLVAGCQNPANGTNGPTPEEVYTLSGSVTLPEAAAGELEYVVVLDVDHDISNGFVKLREGACPDASESFVFSMADVPDGSYCLYAFVDTDGSGGGIDSGDYLGYCGLTTLGQDVTQADHPATPDLLVEADCDTADIALGIWTWSNGEFALVTGTITLPQAPAAGAPWIVFLDSDGDSDNGFITWAEGTCTAALTYDYSFEAAPGDRFLYALIDNDGSDELSGGDCCGFYSGGALSPLFFAPTAANAAVPATGSMDFDFLLGLWPPQYSLSVTDDGNGSTSPAGTVTVDHGDPTDVSATPDSGYVFDSWEVTTGSADIADPEAADTSVTLSSGDATVTANFTPLPQYSLTVADDGNGSTSPAGTVPVIQGVARAISATADSGYVFDSWEVTSGSADIVDPYSADTTVTLKSRDATVTACFAPEPTAVSIDTPSSYETVSGTYLFSGGYSGPVDEISISIHADEDEHNWAIYDYSGETWSYSYDTTGLSDGFYELWVCANFEEPSQSEAASLYFFIDNTGEHSISGSINMEAGGPATIGPPSRLVVHAIEAGTDDLVAASRVDSGSFPYNYSLGGLDNGTYYIAAFLSLSGEVEVPHSGDYLGEYPGQVTIDGSNTSDIDFTLSEWVTNPGTLTVELVNAGAAEGKHVYFAVVDYGAEPDDVFLWPGFGYFTISSGGGSALAIDDSGDPAVLPGGIYDIYLIVNLDDSIPYPPSDPYSIEPGDYDPMGMVSTLIDGNTTWYFDYTELYIP